MRPVSALRAVGELRGIPTASIEKNKENPRILFRQEEMDSLLDSIRRYGIQVPLSVYHEKRRYVLIDGERRWRCALKLNLATVPALVQSKPSKLDNLLLMFNIHALREQWDLLTIALKLRDIIALVGREDDQRPTEIELSRRTGLPRGVIRRCRLLLELPDKYRNTILTELAKPKPQQKLTEDFFIEMERALKTVERRMPEVVDNKDRIRAVLIQKFKRGVIPNRVHFRQLAKIARAENVESDAERAQKVLMSVFASNDYSIEAAFKDSVSAAYTERDVLNRLDAVLERLDDLRQRDVDSEIRDRLRRIVEVALRLLDEVR